jgi:ADP-ribose pyrophosphatase YjhB (NUDIX family)
VVKKLSYGDFLKSFELVPRLTVELVVENDKKEIFLLERKSDPFKEDWHLPGGFLLKDEKLTDCIDRIAIDELGLGKPSKAEFLGLFENLEGDPRGHILHYVVRITNKPKAKGKFFGSLPPNTISYQKKFLQELGYQ